MKRLLIYGMCFILILGVTACSSTSKKSLIEISYEEYQTKIENQESFILYIGSTTCTHCQEFKPRLEDVVAAYDLDVYYLDIYKLDKEQSAYIWDASKINGTPEVMFVENGNIKLFPRIQGAVSKDIIISKFKSAGYIK